MNLTDLVVDEWCSSPGRYARNGITVESLHELLTPDSTLVEAVLLLAYMGCCEGKPFTVLGIARRLGMTHETAFDVVAVLEEHGVARRVSAHEYLEAICA